MKKFNLLLITMLMGFAGFGANPPAGSFDLEVAVSVPNPNPTIYTNVTVTVTAQNTGGMPGVNIQIRVGVCGTAAFSFVQENKLVWTNTGNTATGTWDWLNQRWTIPTLAPGQTATLTFTLFTLTTDPRGIQVFTQSAGTPDVDSSPGNLPTGNSLWVCTDNEDDEAVLTLNGGAAPCAITAGVSGIQCNDNGTPANPADDKFSFTLTATNPAASTGFGVFIVQTSQFFQGTYGSPLTIQNVPISTGNLTLNLTDNVTGGCSVSLTVTPPAPCSGGQLPDFNLVSFFAVQPVSGGGSAVVNPNDPVPAGTTLNIPDHFANLNFPVILPQFQVAINAYLSTDAVVDAGDVPVIVGSREITASTQNFGFTEGSIGTGAIPVNTQPGNYFLILKYDATNVLAESNESNNTKSVPIVVTAAPSGSIDLSLKMVQQTANPVIYSNYLTTLEIRNDGQQTATGVKVKWAKPTGVVYTGGNEFVASQGSFNPNGDQVWTVGVLPAGGVESLTVSYFLLQNGAPVTYAQVIAANETDVDSQPNNGTPPTPVQDDEANSGGTAPPVLTPDLTISNLIFSNGPGTPGQVLAYNFDLANIGNGNAPQDFIVRAWISTSPTFNTTGIQDGIVPTGNFIAGFSVAEVPGASMLPSTLAAGQYYLHLWVDADAQVTESNENNNTVTAPFLVQAATGPGVCDDLIGGGTIQCVWQNSSGFSQVYYNSPNGYRVAILDGDGQVASNQSAGTGPVFPVFRISNGNFEKLENNAVVFSVPIPTALSSQYSGFFSFTSFNDGYVIFAYDNVNYKLYAIRTDANFVVQQTVLRGTYSYSGMHMVTNLYQVSPNRLAFIEYYNAGGTVSDLKMMDGTLTDVYYSNLHSPNYYGSGASLYPTGCGNFMVKVSLAYYCHRGSCFSMYYREGYFTDTEFKTVHTYSTGLQSSMGFGTGYHTWELINPDGSTITASYNVPMINGLSINTNVVKVLKMQGSSTVWTKYVKLSNAASVRRIALSGNELVFLSEKNNAVFVEAMNCVEPTNPRADLTILVLSGTSPTGLQAGGTGNIYPYLLNQGTAPASDFDLKLVLSADNVYSPSSDILLGSVSILSLAPGFSSQQTINYTVPANIASGTYQFMLVADAGNVVAESNESNNLYMTPVTVTGGGTPPSGCAAITITPGPGSITIAGANAPHVLIKVFKPNWTLAFQCLDNCANPLVVSGLTTGAHPIQVKLLDTGWGEICYLEQTVNVPAGPSPLALPALKGRAVQLKAIYPNPVYFGEMTVEIWSKEEGEHELEAYDLFGRLVFSQKITLLEGLNEVKMNVADYRSGTYYLNMPGENWKYMPVRFVVARW